MQSARNLYLPVTFYVQVSSASIRDNEVIQVALKRYANYWRRGAHMHAGATSCCATRGSRALVLLMRDVVTNALLLRLFCLVREFLASHHLSSAVAR